MNFNQYSGYSSSPSLGFGGYTPQVPQGYPPGSRGDGGLPYPIQPTSYTSGPPFQYGTPYHPAPNQTSPSPYHGLQNPTASQYSSFSSPFPASYPPAPSAGSAPPLTSQVPYPQEQGQVPSTFFPTQSFQSPTLAPVPYLPTASSGSLAHPNAPSPYPSAPTAYPPVSGYPHPQTANPGPYSALGAAPSPYGAPSSYQTPPAQSPAYGSSPTNYNSILSYRDIPTVRPVVPFDPSSDSATLRKAMKGFGTDEVTIVQLLSHRTSQQRMQIQAAYARSYGRDLIRDLQKELSGNFEMVVMALMLPLPVYLANELHEAMHGFGTNERTLVEILCTRDNASLRSIKDAYQRQYNTRLEDAIRKETSGHFGRLLISMCAACRDEYNADTNLAPSLAQSLYRAGEKKLGTNEEEFNRILSSYSYPLLRCVFEDYRRITGHDFERALNSELSGDLKKGFKAIYMSIQNRPAFFASEIREAMSGFGTKDRALTRLIVSRSEIDLGNIKMEYQKMFGKPLLQAIRSDTSGDYKRILIALAQG